MFKIPGSWWVKWSQFLGHIWSHIQGFMVKLGLISKVLGSYWVSYWRLQIFRLLWSHILEVMLGLILKVSNFQTIMKLYLGGHVGSHIKISGIILGLIFKILWSSWSHIQGFIFWGYCEVTVKSYAWLGTFVYSFKCCDESWVKIINDT